MTMPMFALCLCILIGAWKIQSRLSEINETLTIESKILQEQLDLERDYLEGE